MELEQILKLIDAVSKSEVEHFSMEEGNLKLDIKKAKKKKVVQMAAEPLAATAVPAAVSIEETEPQGNKVKAPLVGTFYNAPSPEEAPFVQVGDRVEKGQTLGIIEAMKLMNEIQSDYAGVVTAILAENEQMVEYGQPLFVIQ